MKKYLQLIPAILLFACAGTMRDCRSSCAGSLGADWIVVQYRADGSPMNCWRLPGVSIDNEGSSDGIYWASTDGHLVHISGWYNRVQISHSDWKAAAKMVGVELDRCGAGAYLPSKTAP